LGIPKQLVDTGDGVPLIQRSINQFRCALPGAEIYLLARHDRNDFLLVTGTEFIRRKDDVHRPILVEILENIINDIRSSRDLLLVYGDVYFSSKAIKKIRKKIILEWDTITFFGRRNQNPQFGNTGGEDFAVYIPQTYWRMTLDYHRLLKRLYIGHKLYRYGTWEMITLLSALKKAGIPGIPEPQLIDNSGDKTVSLMAKIWAQRDFDLNHWVDIDDETEDFDFPCEYIERLRRMVEWVGQAIDSRNS